MSKPLLVLALLTIAAGSFLAGPASADTTPQFEALQDLMDRRSQQIAVMNAYSAQLESILLRAGFPREALTEPLTLQQRLDRGIPHVHCDAMSLAVALEALANTVHVKIVTDWKALAHAGVDRDAPVTCDLRNIPAPVALNALLESAGGTARLTFEIDDDKLRVTTTEIASKHVLTRIYDLQRLLPRSPHASDTVQQVIKLIIDTVAADSWQDNGGSVGTIESSGSKIKITQTRPNLEAIEELLAELDPTAEDARLQEKVGEQEREILALQKEIDWRIARCRSVAIHVPPTLSQALQSELPDMDFVAVPLATCILALEESSGQTINVNWKMLHSEGIEQRTPITLTLRRQTLAVGLRELVAKASQNQSDPIQFEVENNTVAISTQEEFDRANAMTRAYDVRDLPAFGKTRQQAIDYLAKSIIDRIDPDTWRDAGGTLGSIRELQGQFIITQSRQAHARIKAYLDQLRNLRN